MFLFPVGHFLDEHSQCLVAELSALSAVFWASLQALPPLTFRLGKSCLPEVESECHAFSSPFALFFYRVFPLKLEFPRLIGSSFEVT